MRPNLARASQTLPMTQSGSGTMFPADSAVVLLERSSATDATTLPLG